MPVRSLVARLCVLACLCAGAFAPTARAQSTAPVRVFLDCQNTFCDADFFRTEVAFVDYVRDRVGADVQALVTSQPNGAGGTTYTLRLIGLGRFAGRDDTFEAATGATATSDDRRRTLARTLGAGLVRYAALGGALDRFTITSVAASSAATAAPVRDPWNRWVYRVSANGNFNGEKRYSSRSIRTNASATRTTDRWKSSLSAYRSANRNAYVLDSVTTDVVEQRRYGADGQLVRSLGPRLSAGAEAGASFSTFNNTRRAFSLSPGIEANLFPYTETTRRSATLRYSVGVTAITYRDSTIYDKIREILPEHRLVASTRFNQAWGSVSVTGSASQYLNHPGQYYAGLFGNANVRVVKGLSFNLFASTNLLRNQRALERGDASDADVYTRRRALGSGYNYYAGMGVSYTFGSILSGAVNPRFGGGGDFYFSD